MEIKSLFHVLFLISLSFSAASAQTCKNYKFTNNEIFDSCYDHPVLNSFLHWTYFPSNASLKLAFRRPNTDSNTWTAWAINPQGLQMAGSQALVAHLNSSGTPIAFTSNVSSTTITTLVNGSLSFQVSNLRATHLDNELIIFANLILPSNTTTINQVWQFGPLSQGSPARHSIIGDNRMSHNILNLLEASPNSPPMVQPNPNPDRPKNGVHSYGPKFFIYFVFFVLYFCF